MTRPPLGRPFKLDAVQEKAVSELATGKILVGGVGVGKSITAAAYYVEKESPKDVVVITTAKKRDSREWEEEFFKVGVGLERDGTLHGTLTVDSWNNIANYVERTDTFFIFDEQRVVGRGAWTKSFLKITRSNPWILLSATPGDTWHDYIPVFIANGFFRTRTEFDREHVIYKRFVKFPAVERYVGVNRLVKLKNSLMVEMPYERHTTRHLKYIHVDYDKEQLHRVVKDRWNIYTDEPLVDVAEMFRVGRKLVNGDASRAQVVRDLLKKHPRLIIFYNFNYELEMLREIGAEWLRERDPWNTGPAFLDVKNDHVTSAASTSASRKVATERRVAEWNGHKHENVPETDEWIYLVQYTAGAEGWNCTTTDAMLMFSLTYSYKVWHQAFGRIDRRNTPYTDLWYYAMISQSVIDGAIAKSLKEKKNFNERRSSLAF